MPCVQIPSQKDNLLYTLITNQTTRRHLQSQPKSQAASEHSTGEGEVNKHRKRYEDNRLITHCGIQ